MKHVFVETNWVVDYAKPEYLRSPEAKELLDRADAGEFTIYLPSLCLTEAHGTIKRKFHPSKQANAVRSFFRWYQARHGMPSLDAQTLHDHVNTFEQTVISELNALGRTLAGLKNHGPSLQVFPLTERMLERAAELGAGEIHLEPFDRAILAAILEKAGEILAATGEDICFCELDSDLKPWGKHGGPKPALTHLYDAARVWVYGDFKLEWPARPADW